MLTGAHSIIYSTNADADRAFLRDVLKLTRYFMVDEVDAFVAEMKTHGIACDPVQNQRWGLVTQLTLPGGGKIGVYQPCHARPEAMNLGKAPAKPRKRSAKKPAPKKPATRAEKKRRR